MNEQQIDDAATHLAAARISGRPGARMPESCRPADIESALAIQRRVVALMGQDDRRLEMLGASERPAGQRRADLRADDLRGRRRTR